MLSEFLKKGLCIIVLSFLFLSCSGQEKKNVEKDNLLMYCGITMVKPIKKLGAIFEQSHNCTITIIQGGSEDLYQSLKMSQTGDLYFPGSPYYRTKHLQEGLLGDFVEVGYNQATMVVPKGNPKQIDSDINNLSDSRYKRVCINSYKKIDFSC